MMETINEVQRKFHHLAQFLAAFSNSYLPKAQDDSQSNMEWDIAKKALISRTVDGIYLSFHFLDLTLRATKDNTVKSLSVSRLSRNDIDTWIRETLDALGLNASKFHCDLGFNLDTPFNNFKHISEAHREAISSVIEQRSTARKALQSIQQKHEATTEIRIWPHHFDTGMLIDISEKKDLSKGIGIGYSIADAVCEVPYFYAYAWPNGHINHEIFPELKHGMWIIEDWKGAILTVNMHHKPADVKAFYKEAIACYSKNMP